MTEQTTFTETKRYRVLKGETEFLADQLFDRIVQVRRIFIPGGCTYPLIRTFAGDGTGDANPGTNVGDGGDPLSAKVYAPNRIAATSIGDVYISTPSNGTIRKVTSATNIISTVMGVQGNTVGGRPTFGSPASGQSVDYAPAICLDGQDNLVFADDKEGYLALIDTSGILNLFADISAYYLSLGMPVFFRNTDLIDICNFGTLVYVCDKVRQIITKIDAGTISIFAGLPDQTGYTGDNGPATSAKLHNPSAIACDPDGNLYLYDSRNYVIRRIDAATNIITTWAGNGTGSYPPTLTGDKLSVDFSSGQIAFSFDTAGNCYVRDNDFGPYSYLRKIATDGTVTIFAGDGTDGYGGDGGPPLDAKFYTDIADGIYVDQFTNDIYVCDGNNNRVRILPC